MSIQYTDNITVLNGVTATATSSAYDLSKRQQATVTFQCANHTSGNGVFTVDASNDGVNWVAGIALRDAKATASATYVTSVTLSSNTTTGVQIPAGFRYYRFVCTVTTDGTYTAVMESAG